MIHVFLWLYIVSKEMNLVITEKFQQRSRVCVARIKKAQNYYSFPLLLLTVIHNHHNHSSDFFLCCQSHVGFWWFSTFAIYSRPTNVSWIKAA